jgi:hypothetical protein
MKNNITPIPSDADWLKALQTECPKAILCLESRPLSECKTISAAVLPDSEYATTTVFVKVSLEWLASWPISEIRPQMNITAVRPRIPQLVIEGDTIQQFNTISEVQILLITKQDTATYISFPWNPDQFHILKETKRWIFWSLSDELKKASTHYWGYGDFGSLEGLDDYIAKRISSRERQPSQPETTRDLINGQPLALSDIENHNKKTDSPIAHYETIHEAARKGNLADVKRYLQNGVDENTRDTEGRTPPSLAVSQDTTESLIQHGAKSRETINEEPGKKDKDDRVKLILLMLLIPIPGIILLFLFSGVSEKSIEGAKVLYGMFLVLWVVGSLVGVGSLLVDRAIKRGGALLGIVNTVNVICGFVIFFTIIQVLAGGVHSLSATQGFIALAAGGFNYFLWNKKSKWPKK